jgi:hypothetical protein
VPGKWKIGQFVGPDLAVEVRALVWGGRKTIGQLFWVKVFKPHSSVVECSTLVREVSGSIPDAAKLNFIGLLFSECSFLLGSPRESLTPCQGQPEGWWARAFVKLLATMEEECAIWLASEKISQDIVLGREGGLGVGTRKQVAR